MENRQKIGLQVAIIGCKLALLCFDKAITLCSSVNSPGDGPAVVMFGEKGSRKRCSGLGGQPRSNPELQSHCMMHGVHKVILRNM